MTQAIQQDIRIPWIPCLKIPLFVFFLAETPEDGDQGRVAAMHRVCQSNQRIRRRSNRTREGNHRYRIKQNLSECRTEQITIERPFEIN